MWQIVCEILLIIKHWFVKHVLCFWICTSQLVLPCIAWIAWWWLYLFLILSDSVYKSYFFNNFDIKIETKYNKLSLTGCWQNNFYFIYRCSIFCPLNLKVVIFLSMLFVNHTFKLLYIIKNLKKFQPGIG